MSKKTHLILQRKVLDLADEIHNGLCIRIVKQHGLHLVEGFSRAEINGVVLGDVVSGVVIGRVVLGVRATDGGADDILLLPLAPKIGGTDGCPAGKMPWSTILLLESNEVRKNYIPVERTLRMRGLAGRRHATHIVLNVVGRAHANL